MRLLSPLPSDFPMTFAWLHVGTSCSSDSLFIHFFISAVDLSNVLTPDSLMPLLADLEFREQLAPFLPAGEELPQSPTELSSTLRSPQFQQVS